MKAMSILAIIFSSIFLLWFLLFISSGDNISKEEFALVGIVFSLWSLAFGIVALVKTAKKAV